MTNSRSTLGLGALFISIFICGCDDDGRFQPPKTDVDVDVAEDEETLGDTNSCTPGEPFPWSCGFENTCPQLPEVPPEPYRPGRPPLEEGPTPRLLWAEAERCPEFPNAYMVPVAYMETQLDGQLHEAVLMTVSGGSPNTLSDVLLGMSLNDANTGKVLACYPFPGTDHTFLSNLFPVVSEWGRFFHVTHTEQGETGLAAITSIWSSGPGEGGFFHSYATNLIAHDLVLNSAGELVFMIGDEMVGLDPQSGLPYWTLDFGDYSPREGTQKPAEQLQVRFSHNDRSYLRSLGACGVENGPETAGLNALILENAQIVQTEDRQLIVTVNGVETVRENPCTTPTQVGPDIVSCVRQKNGRLSLISFKLDGSWRSDVLLPGERLETQKGVGIVAGPNNIIVLTVRGPTTLAVFDRTMAIDVLTNEVKWTYEGEENRHSRGLLTPRGVLLMGRGALQTDVFGLAPTYYPRGFLGGNENRGYVALPE